MGNAMDKFKAVQQDAQKPALEALELAKEEAARKKESDSRARAWEAETSLQNAKRAQERAAAAKASEQYRKENLNNVSHLAPPVFL